jgi:predicted CxxxxCH...CXXCH cytochrome family protein
MPQVKTATFLFAGLLTLTASFIGCSDPNAQSPVNADTGSHAANWLPAAHMAAAASDLNSCSTCHGADYKGGVSGVSCTSCHLGSPTSVHPTDWSPVYCTHGPYVNSSPTATSACANQYCHGTTLTGVPDSGPSCTSCHMGGVTTIHPAGWLGDACSNHGTFVLTSPSGTSGCANAYCHGTNLGGVPQSGPSCTKCHPTIPTSPSCGTCHGIPPDGLAPAGNAYPNLPGKHATHMAFSGITCEVCHSRSCDKHLNGTVDVIFDAVYNAKSGTGSFDTTAKTCSEVSCHGGPRTQTLAQMQQNPPQSGLAQTPDWYAGSITVGSQCQACHIYGTTEFNSYYSGKHFFHLGGEGVLIATCTDCHDTIKLTNSAIHFTNLGSHVISAGTASATTWSWLNYNGITCTNATTGCHQGETRNWWQ